MRFLLFGACLLLASSGTHAQEGGNVEKGGTFGWDMSELWKEAQKNTHKIIDPILHPGEKAETAPPRTKQEQMQIDFESDMTQIRARMTRIRNSMKQRLQKGGHFQELRSACQSSRAPKAPAYKAARAAIQSLSKAPGPVIGKLRRFSDQDFFIVSAFPWAEARSQRSTALNSTKNDMVQLFAFTWVMDIFRNRKAMGAYGNDFSFGLEVGEFETAKRAFLFACLVTGDYPDDDKISHDQVLMAFRSFAMPDHVGLPGDVLFMRSLKLYQKEMREHDPWVSTLSFGRWKTEYVPPPCRGPNCEKYTQAANDEKLAHGRINVFLGRAKKKKS